MKERPVLLTDPKVRAVLDGRASQARFVVRPQPPPGYDCIGTGYVDDPAGKFWGLWIDGTHPDPVGAPGVTARCPCGKPGDRLWVRETWAIRDGMTVYRASPCNSPAQALHSLSQTWRPSVHMPRWASRLTLEITGIRFERLQDISEADASAEGAHQWLMAKRGRAYDSAAEAACRWTKRLDPKARVCSHRGEFAASWDSTYDKRGFGWDANPWAIMVSFKCAFLTDFRRVEAAGDPSS